MNITLLEKARCILFTVGPPKNFWAETVSTTYYLVNSSSSTAIEYKTPKEVWSGKPTDYSSLKIFDSPVYTHVNDGKLKPRAKKYIILDPKSPKFLISRYVTFDESFMLHQKKDSVDTSYSISDKHQVELQFDALKMMLEATTDQSIKENMQYKDVPSL